MSFTGLLFDKFECPRCGSDEWSYCDYGGCSGCRPHEERNTDDPDCGSCSCVVACEGRS